VILSISSDKVISKIRDFYEHKIKSRLTAKDMVIDFAVDGDNVYILEMNPYNNFEGCGTDAALFNWKLDRKLLDEGPFECRFEMKETENLEKMLTEEFRVLFDLV